MKTGIYTGTIQSEPYGVPFDYKKGDLYLMNRFLCYLIQNQDAISARISEQFTTLEADRFLSLIKQYDEFEVLYFHNLKKIEIQEINFDDFVFQLGDECIILKQMDIELIFPLPINKTLEHAFLYNDLEIDFGNIERYYDKKVKLNNDEDFPHIFMTEIQIKSNIESLTNIIDDLLTGLGVNSNSNKTEMAILFDHHFSG